MKHFSTAAEPMMAMTAGCLAAVFAAAQLVAHPGAHEALTYMDRRISEAPNRQSLYIERGIIYSNDGQYPEALADFKRAVVLGDPILTGFDFGVLFYRMGDLDTSRLYLNWFLKRFPNHTPSLEYRARAARDAGDYEAAVADFKRVFELQDRPNPGHYISAAEMLQSMGRQGIDEALDILDQGNETLGLTPQLQRFAVQLEVRRNEPEQALRRMRELQLILADSPDWKVDMAVLLMQHGDAEQAAPLLDAALAQLDTMRKTPARQKLREQVEQLRRETP